MIAVQVAHQHGVDAVGVDAVALERDQRRGAAIDQKPRLRRGHQEAGMIPAAAAEGIAAPEKPDLHADLYSPSPLEGEGREGVPPARWWARSHTPHPAAAKLASLAKPPQSSPARGEGGSLRLPLESTFL